MKKYYHSQKIPKTETQMKKMGLMKQSHILIFQRYFKIFVEFEREKNKINSVYYIFLKETLSLSPVFHSKKSFKNEFRKMVENEIPKNTNIFLIPSKKSIARRSSQRLPNKNLIESYAIKINDSYSNIPSFQNLNDSSEENSISTKSFLKFEIKEKKKEY